MRSKTRTAVRCWLLVVISGVLAACSSGSGTQPAVVNSALGPLQVVTVASSPDEVLAALYVVLLHQTGFDASVTTASTASIADTSLNNGAVVVEPGTSAEAGMLGSAVTSLDPSKAVNQIGFAISRTFAARHHLVTLSDLGRSGLPVTLGAPKACASQAGCEPGLKQSYGINVTKLETDFTPDSTTLEKAVESGDVTLGEVTTTDGSLGQYNLQLLADDQGLEPSGPLLPIVNAAALKAHPQIATALNPLAPVLTTSDLATLDGEVGNGQTAQVVAAAYLKAKGLT